MWSVATNLKIVALSKKPKKRDLIPTLITGRTSQTIFKKILSRDFEKMSVYISLFAPFPEDLSFT